jgi:hypothetical protein
MSDKDLHDVESGWNPHDLLGEQFRPVTPPASTPKTILEEAATITSGDRQRYYGHPSDNHGNTATFWSAYLNRKYGAAFRLTVRDVALMMVLLKISRDANAQKRDNLVDICGYTRNIEQDEERRMGGGR